MNNTPEIKIWHDMRLIRISDVGEGFSKWLYGQTIPLVEEDNNPSDWAYYWDYQRFIHNYSVID